MEKGKRMICFLITILGIIILVTAQTIILIDDEAEERREEYIKSNIVIAARKCVKEEKCKGDKVTVLDLLKLEYINGYFASEVTTYSTVSYVDISNYEVTLIEKEDN